MSAEMQAAVQAALDAGALLRSHLGRLTDIRSKGPIDLVTEADRGAEALIFNSLREAFPAIGFLGEEGSLSSGDSGACWVVDPLDGTTNFSHSYPLFCTSIALEEGGQVRLGVVYNPVLNELFTAEAGGGALLNGQPIHVTSTTALDSALVASGFPYDVWDTPRSNLPQWAEVTRRVLSIRCDGSAALDLCHLAAGRLDAYWELDLMPWDMAAGALIVQEAGGTVTSVTGGPYEVYGRQVLASNGPLHPAMLELIRQDGQDKNLAGWTGSE